VTEDDAWILLDGPEPERLRPVLDALRDAPPSTPEGQARVLRGVMERLERLLDEEDRGEEHQDEDEYAASTKPRPAPAPGEAVPVAEAGVTVRSPLLQDAAPAPGLPGPGARAVLPFVSNTADNQVVPFPELTIHQYASLRAELAVHPEAEARILPLYQVFSKPSLDALHAHWQELLLLRPAMRAEFAQLFAEYVPVARVQRR
jgi:hypothetical protein